MSKYLQEIEFAELFEEKKEVAGPEHNLPILSCTIDGIKNQNERFNKQIASKDNSSYLVAERDEIVLSPLNLWMGGIGIQDICEKGVVSPAYKVFKINSKRIFPVFAKYLIRSHQMIKLYGDVSSSGASVVRRNLDLDLLKRSQILIPQINEQIKISEILISVDRMIELTSIEISKLKNLKGALEVDIFSKLNSNLNTLLGDFSRIAVGIVSGCTEEYTDKGVPFLRSQNIKQNRIDEGNIIYISEEFNKKNKKSILSEGDVAIVRSGVNSGMAAVVSQKYAGANCFSLVIVKLDKNKCLPSYLSYFINSKIGQSYIQKFNFGSAQANFNVSEAVKMPIPIPSLGDQNKIIKAISAFDDITWSKLEILEKYSNLKKGLMNDLLTGKVRVTV